MITTWTPLSQANKGLIPDHFLSWLEKPYILSQSLKSICNTFSIQVINQSLGVLNPDEVDILGSDEPFSLIRQVYLVCDNQPYVFARVCIPYQTLFRNKEAFETLGSNPIGETLLYNNARVTRGEFQVKSLNSDNLLFKDALSLKEENNELWGRRSLFNMEGNPLLITEFFLSSIPSYLKVYEAQLKNQLDILTEEVSKSHANNNPAKPIV